MAKTDVAATVRKWSSRLQGATQDIEAGVRSVTVAPTQAAKAKKATFKARVNEAIDNGKWERGLDRVDNAQWQDAMIKKGIPRITSGVAESEPKMNTFFSELLPYTASVSAQVRALPNATEQQRDARALKAIQLMRQFKRQRR